MLQFPRKQLVGAISSIQSSQYDPAAMSKVDREHGRNQVHCDAKQYSRRQRGQLKMRWGEDEPDDQNGHRRDANSRWYSGKEASSQNRWKIGGNHQIGLSPTHKPQHASSDQSHAANGDGGGRVRGHAVTQLRKSVKKVESFHVVSRGVHRGG
jgi:hypothetical protein